MNIEKAKEILQKDILIDDCFINHELDEIFKESTKIAIDTVLNELEKKDKVIDLIADELRYQKGMRQDDIFCYDMCENEEGYVICDRENCKEHIKEYFYKRVGEENDAIGK